MEGSGPPNNRPAALLLVLEEIVVDLQSKDPLPANLTWYREIVRARFRHNSGESIFRGLEFYLFQGHRVAVVITRIMSNTWSYTPNIPTSDLPVIKEW